MRIYLIGFMGVGKSYLGRRLAEALSFPFIDLDEDIAEKAGCSIPEFFRTNGEAAFRQWEASCLRTTATRLDAVVATGGGAPCFQRNMDWMNENGLTVFLHATTQVLAERLLPELHRRPLLKGLSEQSLPFFIEQKLADRMPFYQQAHFQLSVAADGIPAISQLVAYLRCFLGP